MAELTKQSKAILSSTKETIESFFEIYKGFEKEKSSDEKNQDLLRAIILFSSSGIDAIVKKLINDTIATVINNDEGAAKQFKDFVDKKIQENKNGINSKLLSELFTCDNPKEQLISVLKRDLTANSLQSAEELFKVASYFNIPTIELSISVDELKKIFKVRNQISHEMDVELNSVDFKRNKRTKKEAEEISKELLKLAEKFIFLIDIKISQNPKSNDSICVSL